MRATFPVMVLLGPLTMLQHFFWQWRRGLERTTWQYLQAESQGTPGASRRRVAHYLSGPGRRSRSRPR
jgi:hypothetical protein